MAKQKGKNVHKVRPFFQDFHLSGMDREKWVSLFALQGIFDCDLSNAAHLNPLCTWKLVLDHSSKEVWLSNVGGTAYRSSDYKLSTANPGTFCSPDNILQWGCFPWDEVSLVELASFNVQMMPQAQRNIFNELPVVPNLRTNFEVFRY